MAVDFNSVLNAQKNYDAQKKAQDEYLGSQQYSEDLASYHRSDEYKKKKEEQDKAVQEANRELFDIDLSPSSKGVSASGGFTDKLSNTYASLDNELLRREQKIADEAARRNAGAQLQQWQREGMSWSDVDDPFSSEDRSRSAYSRNPNNREKYGSYANYQLGLYSDSYVEKRTAEIEEEKSKLEKQFNTPSSQYSPFYSPVGTSTVDKLKSLDAELADLQMNSESASAARLGLSVDAYRGQVMDKGKAKDAQAEANRALRDFMLYTANHGTSDLVTYNKYYDDYIAKRDKAAMLNQNFQSMYEPEKIALAEGWTAEQIRDAAKKSREQAFVLDEAYARGDSGLTGDTSAVLKYNADKLERAAWAAMSDEELQAEYDKYAKKVQDSEHWIDEYTKMLETGVYGDWEGNGTIYRSGGFLGMGGSDPYDPAYIETFEVRDARKAQLAQEQQIQNMIGAELAKRTFNSLQEYLSTSGDKELIKAYEAFTKKELGGEGVTALSPEDAFKKALKKADYTDQQIADILEYSRRATNEIKAAKTEEWVKEHLTEGMGGIVGTVLSVATSLASGVGLLEMARMAWFNDSHYVTADLNASVFAPQRITSTIRDTITENMSDYDSVFSKSVQADLYGIATSTLDSMASFYAGMGIGSAVGAVASAGASLAGSSVSATAAVGAKAAATVGNIAASTILGFSAAAETAVDLTEKGFSANEALTGALVAGAFETIFESISIEQFSFMEQTGNVTSIKDLLLNMGKSYVTNFSEELATELANVVFDSYAHGDLSDYAQLRANYAQEYMKVLADPAKSDEYNQEMAELYGKKMAAKESWDRVLKAGWTGGLQGLLMGFTGFAKAQLVESYNFSKAQSLIDTDIDSLNTAELRKHYQDSIRNYAQIGYYGAEMEDDGVLNQRHVDQFKAAEQHLKAVAEELSKRDINAVVDNQAHAESDGQYYILTYGEGFEPQRYVGATKENMPDGSGVSWSKNGNVFYGTWENGKFVKGYIFLTGGGYRTVDTVDGKTTTSEAQTISGIQDLPIAAVRLRALAVKNADPDAKALDRAMQSAERGERQAKREERRAEREERRAAKKNNAQETVQEAVQEAAQDVAEEVVPEEKSVEEAGETPSQSEYNNAEKAEEFKAPKDKRGKLKPKDLLDMVIEGKVSYEQAADLIKSELGETQAEFFKKVYQQETGKTAPVEEAIIDEQNEEAQHGGQEESAREAADSQRAGGLDQQGGLGSAAAREEGSDREESERNDQGNARINNAEQKSDFKLRLLNGYYSDANESDFVSEADLSENERDNLNALAESNIPVAVISDEAANRLGTSTRIIFFPEDGFAGLLLTKSSVEHLNEIAHELKHLSFRLDNDLASWLVSNIDSIFKLNNKFKYSVTLSNPATGKQYTINSVRDRINAIADSYGIDMTDKSFEDLTLTQKLKIAEEYLVIAFCNEEFDNYSIGNDSFKYWNRIYNRLKASKDYKRLLENRDTSGKDAIQRAVEAQSNAAADVVTDASQVSQDFDADLDAAMYDILSAFGQNAAKSDAVTRDELLAEKRKLQDERAELLEEQKSKVFDFNIGSRIVAVDEKIKQINDALNKLGENAARDIRQNDSSRTAQVEKSELRIKELQSENDRITSQIEKAEGNDLRELRAQQTKNNKEISALKKQLKSKKSAQTFTFLKEERKKNFDALRRAVRSNNGNVDMAYLRGLGYALDAQGQIIIDPAALQFTEGGVAAYNSLLGDMVNLQSRVVKDGNPYTWLDLKRSMLRHNLAFNAEAVLGRGKNPGLSVFSRAAIPYFYYSADTNAEAISDPLSGAVAEDFAQMRKYEAAHVLYDYFAPGEDGKSIFTERRKELYDTVKICALQDMVASLYDAVKDGIPVVVYDPDGKYTAESEISNVLKKVNIKDNPQINIRDLLVGKLYEYLDGAQQTIVVSERNLTPEQATREDQVRKLQEANKRIDELLSDEKLEEEKRQRLIEEKNKIAKQIVDIRKEYETFNVERKAESRNYGETQNKLGQHETRDFGDPTYAAVMALLGEMPEVSENGYVLDKNDLFGTEDETGSFGIVGGKGSRGGMWLRFNGADAQSKYRFISADMLSEFFNSDADSVAQLANLFYGDKAIYQKQGTIRNSEKNFNEAAKVAIIAELIRQTRDMDFKTLDLWMNVEKYPGLVKFTLEHMAEKISETFETYDVNEKFMKKENALDFYDAFIDQDFIPKQIYRAAKTLEQSIDVDKNIASDSMLNAAELGNTVDAALLEKLGAKDGAKALAAYKAYQSAAKAYSDAFTAWKDIAPERRNSSFWMDSEENNKAGADKVRKAYVDVLKASEAWYEQMGRTNLYHFTESEREALEGNVEITVQDPDTGETKKVMLIDAMNELEENILKDQARITREDQSIESLNDKIDELKDQIEEAKNYLDDNIDEDDDSNREYYNRLINELNQELREAQDSLNEHKFERNKLEYRESQRRKLYEVYRRGIDSYVEPQLQVEQRDSQLKSVLKAEDAKSQDKFRVLMDANGVMYIYTPKNVSAASGDTREKGKNSIGVTSFEFAHDLYASEAYFIYMGETAFKDSMSYRSMERIVKFLQPVMQQLSDERVFAEREIKGRDSYGNVEGKNVYMTEGELALRSRERSINRDTVEFIRQFINSASNPLAFREQLVKIAYDLIASAKDDTERAIYEQNKESALKEFDRFTEAYANEDMIDLLWWHDRYRSTYTIAALAWFDRNKATLDEELADRTDKTLTQTIRDEYIIDDSLAAALFGYMTPSSNVTIDELNKMRKYIRENYEMLFRMNDEIWEDIGFGQRKTNITNILDPQQNANLYSNIDGLDQFDVVLGRPVNSMFAEGMELRVYNGDKGEIREIVLDRDADWNERNSALMLALSLLENFQQKTVDEKGNVHGTFFDKEGRSLIPFDPIRSYGNAKKLEAMMNTDDPNSALSRLRQLLEKDYKKTGKFAKGIEKVLKEKDLYEAFNSYMLRLSRSDYIALNGMLNGFASDGTRLFTNDAGDTISSLMNSIAWYRGNSDIQKSYAQTAKLYAEHGYDVPKNVDTAKEFMIQAMANYLVSDSVVNKVNPRGAKLSEVIDAIRGQTDENLLPENVFTKLIQNKAIKELAVWTVDYGTEYARQKAEYERQRASRFSQTEYSYESATDITDKDSPLYRFWNILNSVSGYEGEYSDLLKSAIEAMDVSTFESMRDAIKEDDDLREAIFSTEKGISEARVLFNLLDILYENPEISRSAASVYEAIRKAGSEEKGYDIAEKPDEGSDGAKYLESLRNFFKAKESSNGPLSVKEVERFSALTQTDEGKKKLANELRKYFTDQNKSIPEIELTNKIGNAMIQLLDSKAEIPNPRILATVNGDALHQFVDSILLTVNFRDEMMRKINFFLSENDYQALGNMFFKLFTDDYKVNDPKKMYERYKSLYYDQGKKSRYEVAGRRMNAVAQYISNITRQAYTSEDLLNDISKDYGDKIQSPRSITASSRIATVQTEIQNRMSQATLDKLKEELHILETVDAEEVKQRLREARAQGDLSENSEYDEAREARDKLYSKIDALKDRIRNAVVDETVSSTDFVQYGNYVTLRDVDSGNIIEIHVVGESESDPEIGNISMLSRFGSELLGREKDDIFSVASYDGVTRFEVVDISNKAKQNHEKAKQNKKKQAKTESEDKDDYIIYPNDSYGSFSRVLDFSRATKDAVPTSVQSALERYNSLQQKMFDDVVASLDQQSLADFQSMVQTNAEQRAAQLKYVMSTFRNLLNAYADDPAVSERLYDYMYGLYEDKLINNRDGILDLFRSPSWAFTESDSSIGMTMEVAGSTILNREIYSVAQRLGYADALTDAIARYDMYNVANGFYTNILTLAGSYGADVFGTNQFAQCIMEVALEEMNDLLADAQEFIAIAHANPMVLMGQSPEVQRLYYAYTYAANTLKPTAQVNSGEADQYASVANTVKEVCKRFPTAAWCTVENATGEDILTMLCANFDSDVIDSMSDRGRDLYYQFNEAINQGQYGEQIMAALGEFLESKKALSDNFGKELAKDASSLLRIYFDNPTASEVHNEFHLLTETVDTSFAVKSNTLMDEQSSALSADAAGYFDYLLYGKGDMREEDERKLEEKLASNANIKKFLDELGRDSDSISKDSLPSNIMQSTIFFADDPVFKNYMCQAILDEFAELEAELNAQRGKGKQYESLAWYKKAIEKSKGSIASEDQIRRAVNLYNLAIQYSDASRSAENKYSDYGTGYLNVAEKIRDWIMSNAYDVSISAQNIDMATHSNPDYEANRLITKLNGIARDIFPYTYAQLQQLGFTEYYQLLGIQYDDFVNYRNALIDGKKRTIKSAFNNIRNAVMGSKSIKDIQSSLKQNRLDTVEGAYNEIARKAGKQIRMSYPAMKRIMNGLNAWRYAAMLSQLTTHGNNIASTVVNIVNNDIAALPTMLMERAAIKNGKMDQSEATVALVSRFTDKDLYAKAAENYETAKAYLYDRGKLGSRISGILKETGSVIGTRNIGTLLLELEDKGIGFDVYQKQFAQILKARGLSAADFDKLDDVEKQKIQAIAVDQTQTILFRNLSEVSKFLGGISNLPAANVIMTTVMPFATIAGNLATTAYETSIFGLFSVGWQAISEKIVDNAIFDENGNVITSKGMSKLLYNAALKTQEKIDNKPQNARSQRYRKVSLSLVGMVGTLLGAIGRAAGLISGGDDDDEDKARFEGANGYQKYSILINGKYYDLTRCFPASFSLLLGAKIADIVIRSANSPGKVKYQPLDIFQETFANNTFLGDVFSAWNRLQDSWDAINDDKELNDVMVGVRDVAAVVLNGLQNLATQMNPGILKTLENTLWEVNADTFFYNKSSDIPYSVQYFLSDFFEMIPGKDMYRVEKRDMYGEKSENESMGDYLLRVFTGKSSELKHNKYDDWLNKLADTPDPNNPGKTYAGRVIFDDVEKSRRVDNERMTEEEYAAYNDVVASMRRRFLDELTGDELFQNADPEVQASVIEYANKIINGHATDRVKEMRGTMETDTPYTGNDYIGKGTIDLNNRKLIVDDDGNWMTTYSYTIQDDDGKWVNIPGVVEVNGKYQQVDEDTAIKAYEDGNGYFGKFDTLAQALGAADALHVYQEKKYNPSESQLAGLVDIANKTGDFANYALMHITTDMLERGEYSEDESDALFDLIEAQMDRLEGYNPLVQEAIMKDSKTKNLYDAYMAFKNDDYDLEDYWNLDEAFRDADAQGTPDKLDALSDYILNTPEGILDYYGELKGESFKKLRTATEVGNKSGFTLTQYDRLKDAAYDLFHGSKDDETTASDAEIESYDLAFKIANDDLIDLLSNQENTYDELFKANEAGYDTKTFFEAYDLRKALNNDKDLTPAEKADEFRRAMLDKFPNDKDAQFFISLLPFTFGYTVKDENYDKFRDEYGFNAKSASYASDILQGLEPINGYDTVRKCQRVIALDEAYRNGEFDDLGWTSSEWQKFMKEYMGENKNYSGYSSGILYYKEQMRNRK